MSYAQQPQRVLFLVLLLFLSIFNAAFSNAQESDSSSNDYALEMLKNRMSVNMSLYRTLLDQKEEAEQGLAESHEKIDTLEGQLRYLDEEILLTEKKIKQVRKKIGFTELKIQNLVEQIQMKEIIYEEQMEILASYLQLLYVHDRTYANVDNSGGINVVKLLLADSSVSKVFQNKNYLLVLKETTEALLIKIDAIKTNLEKENDRLGKEHVNFSSLQERLLQEEYLLKTQKEAKERLLEETQNKEIIFQKLLVQTKLEQEEVLLEVQHIQQSLDYFKKTGARLKETLSEDQYQKFLKIKDSVQSDKNSEMTRFTLWSVPVKRGFSAYFDDFEYQRVFGINHGALDIRAAQGTPIRVVADGVVLKAKLSDGIGYNYIAIAHEGGFVTVYGHVFDGFVKDGDFVEMGRIIGLTGGMPGTRGAGFRTTGPHLHIEVHYKGQRVDPMLYLPLEEINPAFITNKYQILYQQALDRYGTRLDSFIYDDNESKNINKASSIEQVPEIKIPAQQNLPLQEYAVY